MSSENTQPSNGTIITRKPRITLGKNAKQNLAVLSNGNTTTRSSSQTKKRSSPATKKQKVALELSDNDPIPEFPISNHTEISKGDIMWADPGPGYATPLYLSEMPPSSGLLITQWVHWEHRDQVGYILYDEKGFKWRADASSIHLLGRAASYDISSLQFNFIIYRQDKKFSYGFVPKTPVDSELVRKLSKFGEEEIEPSDVIAEKRFQVTSADNIPQTVLSPPPAPAAPAAVQAETKTKTVNNTIHSPPLGAAAATHPTEGEQTDEEEEEHKKEVTPTFIPASALPQCLQPKSTRRKPVIVVKPPPTSQQAVPPPPPPPPPASKKDTKTIDLCAGSSSDENAFVDEECDAEHSPYSPEANYSNRRWI